MTISPDDRQRIASLRLLVFDFDGVFTDNTVWVDETGRESVRCWRSDGLGLSKLREIGLEMLVLSTERNPVVGARCKKLNLVCEQGLPDKHLRLQEIVAERGLDAACVAYVGNDINDTGCLEFAGLPIVVSDAHPDVLSLARLRTTRPGGFGAVREICDVIAEIKTA